MDSSATAVLRRHDMKNLSKLILLKTYKIKETIHLISAQISLNTKTRPEDDRLVTDKNESSCLNVTRLNTITLIAELHIAVPSQMTPDKFGVIAIQMNGMGCSSVIFYRVRKTSSDCQMKKTDGEVGQLLSSVPNSNKNIFYYQIPVECHWWDDWCKFDGVLAVKNMESDSVEICELNMG